MVKTCLCAGVVLLFIATLALLASNSLRDKSTVPESGATPAYDRFNASGLRFLEYSRDDAVIRLTAEKVIHRKRKSKYFEYQNLKELYLQGVDLDLHLEKHHVPENGYALPFAFLEKYCQSLSGGAAVNSIDAHLQEYGDIDMDVLSRVVFERLSLRIHYPAGRSLTISSDTAFINGQFGAVVLSGNVIVVPAVGEPIHAPEAVLSRKANGVFFPSGHLLKKSPVSRQAFYQFASAGNLVRSSTVPKIRYHDLVEEKEEELYSRIYDRIPLHVRFMFGMMEKKPDSQ